MNKRYILLVLPLLLAAGCKHEPKAEVTREEVRVLQAEPKGQYTVVGEASAFGGNRQMASERLQFHAHRLGANAVILRTTETLAGVDAPVIKVTGTAILISPEAPPPAAAQPVKPAAPAGSNKGDSAN